MTSLPTTSRSPKPATSPVARLRRLAPKRPLTFPEAKRVAELQASFLLQHWELRIGRVSERLIADLPRIDVQYRHGLIGSGLTTWDRGAWRIGINADEPSVRRRFTLAHELKHVVDAADEDVIYGHLPEAARTRHVEAVCDHFAACLLMPRAWVKSLWGQGIQDLSVLSRHFDVSQQAMLIRLQNLGLIEPLPRCRTLQRVGAVAITGARRSYSTGGAQTGRRATRRSFHRLSQRAHQALHTISARSVIT